MSREFRARSRKYRASGYSASGCGVDECAAAWNDSTESGSAFRPSVGTYPYPFEEEDDESFEEVKNAAKQMKKPAKQMQKPKAEKEQKGSIPKISQKTLSCGPMKRRAYTAECADAASEHEDMILRLPKSDAYETEKRIPFFSLRRRPPPKLAPLQPAASRQSLWFEARVWLYMRLFKLQRK